MAKVSKVAADSKVKAVRLMITGQVQRVGYRRLVERAARRRDLVGYVENRRDGTVSVVAEGAETGLRAFVKDIAVKEEPVVVEQIRERWTGATGRYRSFAIKPGRLVDELQEGLGAGQEQLATLTNEFRDYRNEFGDYRKEFGGFHGEFRDFRNDFNGFHGEFRDFRNDFNGFHGEFREYRGEFRSFAERTDENFRLLADKYGEISDKLTAIMNTLAEESRKSREMLEAIREDSKRMGEVLNESMRLLREAVDRLPRQS